MNNGKSYGDVQTNLKLTVEAQRVFSNTFPLRIWEHEMPDGMFMYSTDLYDMEENLYTESEINALLIEFGKMMNEEDDVPSDHARLVYNIGDLIDEAHKMRNAYFFTSPKSAADRRYYERIHSRSLIEWTESGHHYTAELTVKCSCANVYVTGTYTKDGKKTTLTTIIASYRRMLER